MGVGQAERQRALIVLLISTFFAWGGFFMVIPLVSIHYVDGLGWAAAAIGWCSPSGSSPSRGWRL